MENPKEMFTRYYVHIYISTTPWYVIPVAKGVISFNEYFYLFQVISMFNMNKSIYKYFFFKKLEAFVLKLYKNLQDTVYVFCDRIVWVIKKTALINDKIKMMNTNILFYY